MNWPILQEGTHFLIQFSSFDGEDIKYSTVDVDTKEEVIEKIRGKKATMRERGNELRIRIFKYTSEEFEYKEETVRTLARLEKA